MTQEERISNYHKLFDGLKKEGRFAGITVYDSVDPQDCEDYAGNIIHDHVRYMRMFLNFTDNKDKGREFIDNITVEKLQDCGLNPYDGKLDKDYMLSLLDATGKFDIKLEFEVVEY